MSSGGFDFLKFRLTHPAAHGIMRRTAYGKELLLNLRISSDSPHKFPSAQYIHPLLSTEPLTHIL